MYFEGGYTFGNFLINAISIFLFVLWFWLLIIVFSDLFRRKDISGLGKAIWVIALLLVPYLGVFVYLITQGGNISERNAQQAQHAQEELRRIAGFSAADEIEKLNKLKAAGTITPDEYTRMRAKLVQ
jgi:ABC-type transport system involved in multi-copper enzyme maturation permease subunit